MKVLAVRPLSREAFAPFGQVIQLDGARQFAINEGNTQRFHDLAEVDTLTEGGRPIISLFRAEPRPQPVQLSLMERHPLCSQAFVPFAVHRYLIVVDRGGAGVNLEESPLPAPVEIAIG